MKNRMPLSRIALAALALVAISSAAWIASAQDAVKVAPGNHKVLLENDKVRVYDFTAKPGEKIPMHSHPAHVVYFLTDGKVKFTLADGKTTELEAKAGSVRWSDPVTHTLENIGTTEVHAIVTELKGVGAPKAARAPSKAPK